MTADELAVKVEQLVSAVSEIKSKDKDFRKDVYCRLREIEGKQIRTDEKYNAIMSTLEQQGRQLADIGNTLDELRDKPAERWDTVVKTIITGIVSAFVGVILGKGL